MRKFWERRKKILKYCGMNREEINAALQRLRKLADDLLLTDEEENDLNVAIQALYDVRKQMDYD